jgi:acetylornithine/N-succinyldiaminopimelate aminotransferase
VMDVVTADGFLAHVQSNALLLKQRLAALKDTYPDVIEDVRGSGLMIGIKCKTPNTALQSAATAEHLLTLLAGDNVVRLLPPLVVTADEINEACNKLEKACKAVRAKAA